MKFRKILSATLALAMSVSAFAGLATTASAEDVTTNADIVVSSDSVIDSDGVLSGTTNSMTLSDTTGTYPFEINTTNPSLTVGKGTGTVTIDSDEYAESRDVVNVSFDLAFGKLINRSVYFNLNDSTGATIATFDCGVYSSTLTTNLGFEWSDISGLSLQYSSSSGNNNSLANWASRVTFDITLDYAHNRITTTLKNNYNNNSADAVVAMTNTNPLASFVIGSYYDNTARRCEFNNLLITTTAGDYDATQKTITYNYKTTDGKDIPSEDLPSDALTSEYAYVGENFTPIYPESFDTEDCHYTYSSGGDTITVDGSTESVTLLYDAIVNAEITVTATADDGTDLTSSMLSDTSISGYVGGDYSYSPYAYIVQNGVYYKYDGIQEDGSVPAIEDEFVQTSDIKELKYTKADSVVYYVEADSFESGSYSHAAQGFGSNENASGGYQGGYVYAGSGEYLAIKNISIESAGTYKVTANTVGGPSGARKCYLTMDSTTVSDDTPELVKESDTVTCGITSFEVHLDAGTHTFYYVSNGASGCCVDYMVIELVSLDPEITSATAESALATTPETSSTLYYVNNGAATGDTTTLSELVDDVASTYVTTYTIKVANYASGLPTLYFSPADDEAGESLTPTEISDGTPYYYELSDGTYCFIIQTIGISTAATVSIDGAETVDVQ